MSAEFVLRLVGMFVGGFIGWKSGTLLATLAHADPPYLRYVLAISLAGAGLGLVLAPYFTTRPFAWLRSKIRHASAQSLIAGVIGLVVGLIISALLALPLSLLPGILGEVLPFVAAVISSLVCMSIMIVREKDIFGAVGMRTARENVTTVRDNRVLLDTSVIIDGRIADIVQTGFISGPVVVPRFVLNELQRIADSSDALRRNRGRRGLEVLNTLQKGARVPIEISEVEVDDVHEVDAKLVKAARLLNCPIMTNDYNLNRVAELQGVLVLNINELANAVKAVLLPGETLQVHIMQEGKDAGQGVAYLDDGTMVVVEDGRRYMNSNLQVTVTRVLQTVAGRMIFAQPDSHAGR
jgi:uncharacterized protein YacL